MAQAAARRRAGWQRRTAGGRAMIQRVIINADDFGLSHEANRTILGAFQQGLISSATLMANMPAFEEACALTREHDLHEIGRASCRDAAAAAGWRARVEIDTT